MAIDIKFPNITANTERGKLEQIRSYLYQLADQLKWALNSLENGSQSTQAVNQSKAPGTRGNEASTPFNVIGSLRVGHLTQIYSYENKDFNELKSSTGYYADTAPPSNISCKNYPIDKTGLLEVIAVRLFAYQTYRTYDGDVYVRSYCSSTGWTLWKKATLT